MPCILGYFALNSTSHAFYFERQQWRRTTVATSSLLDQLWVQPASFLVMMQRTARKRQLV